MKPTIALSSFLVGSTLLATATSLHAATYYWDDNAAGANFGTAGASTGTWAGPTTGPTAGWSLSSTGANAFAAFTTVGSGVNDALNFGTGTVGLGAGTISVSGAVSANSITYGSQSGSILLSGGTSITMGGTTPTITVNNTQNTINTMVTGTAGLVKAGTGELVLSGTGNSFSGGVNGVGIHLTGGTLTVSGGSTAVTGGTNAIGTYSGENGNFKQTDGTVTAVGDLIVGWNSDSTFTLSGGVTSAANLRHQDGALGVITISGTNTTTVGNVSHIAAGGGTDSFTVNLNTGGTLAANTLTMNLSGSALTTGIHSLNVNFNGGTLKARTTGNLIAAAPVVSGTSSASINVLASTNGAKFDTNSFTATILRPILHDPALGATPDGGLTLNDTAVTKGILVLSGANTYTGATTIIAGTLKLGIGGTSNTVNIANHSFENPTTASFITAPTLAAQGGTGWTFTGASGVAKTTWFSTAPPDGTQAGFIQQDAGTISQAITVGADGLYRIDFQAQGRGGSYGPEGVIVQVDGVSVGTWTANDVSQTQWLSYTAGINLTAGSHTLTFLGNNTAGGDKSVSIDSVQMSQATGSLPTNTPVNLTTAGAKLDLNFTYQTIRSLTGVAGTSVTNGALTIGGTDTTTFAGVISGGSTLTLSGAGSLTLTGANTYTGATTVAAGTLAVNGSLANTATTVQSGGTLQGSGTIGGSVTIQNLGTLAPGNSIESLGTGALTLAAGSTFAYELNKDALTLNESGDLVFITGGLNIANTALLTLTELGTGAGTWDLNEKLTLLSYTGIWNGGQFTYGDTLADGEIFSFSGAEWQFDYDDTLEGANYIANSTGKFVTMTVVPEPGAALIGSLGLLALLRRRRN